MNVLAVRLATGQRGRDVRNVTHRLYNKNIKFKCFNTSKTNIPSLGPRSIHRQGLRHGDELSGRVEENPANSLDEGPGEENERSIQSKGESEEEEMNGRSSIIRRLARAVVTLLSPTPFQSLSKFLSWRAFKLALFLVVGLFMSYVGSRRSPNGSRAR